MENRSRLRDERVEQRKDFTDACVEKGADGTGIARATNRVSQRTFRNGKPSGNRDQWSDDDQRRITITEHFAARSVRDLPDEALPTSANNDRVVEAAGNGAKNGTDFILDVADATVKGAFQLLFGWCGDEDEED